MKMNLTSFNYLLDSWESKDIQEIADHIGVSDATIYGWATSFRKAGGYLPKRAGEGSMLMDEIFEITMQERPEFKLESLSAEEQTIYRKAFPRLFNPKLRRK